MTKNEVFERGFSLDGNGKVLDNFGNDYCDENGCIVYVDIKNPVSEPDEDKMTKYELKMLSNLFELAEIDIDLLSYKGQTKFNELADKADELNILC